MQHQDWETVILKKPTVYKNNNNNKKKEEEDSEFNLPKTSYELKKTIQQARCAKKMTQKELATKVNVPVKTIIEYENGKAIPNNTFIAKLERTLNVKLPRPKKK